MKTIKHFIIVWAVVCFLNMTSGLGLIAQQQPSEEEQKMMQLWQQIAAPGANHKYLEQFAGQWQAEGKSWMKPGDKPTIGQSEIKCEMIMQGRYLKCDYKGTMMGMPYEGMMIIGYDNYKKQFMTMWIDSTGTGFYPTAGNLDQTGKIRTETGEWDDFMTGGKVSVKIVTTLIDADKYLFEMFMVDTATGKEFKNMEMLSTRKK